MNYFTIKELSASVKAAKLSIDNTPPPHVVSNLTSLITNILNPTRAALSRPIYVTSGYRSPELNSAVGGVQHSQHTLGEAADISLAGGSKEENRELFEFIRDNCDFDQLINEHNYSWIHVSHKKEGNNRKQLLKIG